MAGKGRNISEYNASLTREELIEIRRKGGINSGKARAERKTFAEALKLMLSDEAIQDNLLKAMITKATDGDVQAFTAIRDTMGEKPTDKQQLTVEELPVISIGRAKKE